MNRRDALLLMLAVPVVGCNRSEHKVAANEPRVVVHKSESCGCCKLWVSHLEQAGFVVQVVNEDNLGPTKQRVGVPYGMGSCHTAEVEGYFVEGHVPAADIQRLLRERPRAKGLTVPGMPAGSPGMEVPSGQVDPYDVFLVAEDGSTSVFAHHGQ
jgi:hypothetical protein